MSPFEVYRAYLALRNHFNSSSYDYFKYNGKGSSSVESFNKRKDKIFFEKLARHRDPQGLMIANFSKNPKAWIRDMAYTEEGEQNYLEWLKRQQSLSYIVSSELSKLHDDFNENFIVRKNEHPILLRLFSSGAVSAETLCILVDLTNCLEHWDTKLSGDIVWNEVGVFIKKYTPFIKYDREKLKKIVVDNYSIR